MSKMMAACEYHQGKDDRALSIRCGGKAVVQPGICVGSEGGQGQVGLIPRAMFEKGLSHTARVHLESLEPHLFGADRRTRFE